MFAGASISGGIRQVPRIISDATRFTADRAWGAMDIALIAGASVRVHWTDQPYKWHVNDGAEVFMVLTGAVDMDYKVDGEVQTVRLVPGDIFTADIGDAHIARPDGEARILVIEKQGSI